MNGTRNVFSSSDVRIYNRSSIEICGVDEIISYDDRMIVLSVCGIRTVVEGEDLRVKDLSVEDGRICASGRINGLFYDEETVQKKGFFSRLFKG